MASISIVPSTAVLRARQTLEFVAKKTDGTVVAASWSLEPTTGSGTIDATSGLYRAPRWISGVRKATVRATSTPGSEEATAVVDLVPISLAEVLLGLYLFATGALVLAAVCYNWSRLCPSCGPLLVSPPVVTLTASQAQAFTTDSAATWKDPVLTGGIYQAPAKVDNDAKVTVTAVGPSGSRTGTATVLLRGSGWGLAILPPRAAITAGRTLELTALLERAADTPASTSPPAVEWLQPELGGDVQPPTGVTTKFTAPASVDRPRTILVLARTRPAEGVGPDSARVAGAYVTVYPSAADLGGYGDDCINPEGLLVLVALMGCLGGLAHGASSFTTYVGNREFLPSWSWWYLFRPVVGGLVAIIVYLVVSAGFGGNELAATTTDCLKIAGLAALVGLFAEAATLKLRDIFNTLFTPSNDPRRDAAGKDGAPTIEGLEPEELPLTKEDPPAPPTGAPTPPAGGAPAQRVLTLTGTGFAAGCRVMVGSNLRQPVSVTPTVVVVKLDPGDLAQKGELPISVVNQPPDRKSSNVVKLKVT